MLSIPRLPRPNPDASVAASEAGGASSAAPLSAPLTTFGGQEREPDLSPDAERVAFIWDGDPRNNGNLYVKTIADGKLERLTADPAAECCPAWSPDARRIAFLRSRGSGAELLTISASGKEEMLLRRLPTFGHKISWSSNGRYLAVEDAGGISGVSARDGSKHRITTPPDGLSDRWPSLSPDGMHLAFARGNRDFAVHALDLDSNAKPRGEPRRMTFGPHILGGLDWTPDGRALVFGVHGEKIGWRLFKALAGAGPTKAVALAITGWQPSFARRPLGLAVRLAYVAASDDKNIYRIPGPSAQARAARAAPELIVGSSRSDSDPRFSVSGERIVFFSGQSGFGEIWTADSDGANPIPLTQSGRSQVGSPTWSPDGRQIALSAMLQDSFDVYVVDAGGGAPRQITHDPSNEGSPFYSGDGRWIYFMSDRTGRPEIWKIPSAGGRQEQVTREGGYQAIESPDRVWLYYSKSIRRPNTPESVPAEGEPGIFRRPVAGGAEERVLEDGVHGRWALSRTGLYLIRSGDRPPTIDYHPYETLHRRTLMTFPKGTHFGMANSLTVSLDDRWVVYSKYDHVASDLMLVEDYR